MVKRDASFDETLGLINSRGTAGPLTLQKPRHYFEQAEVWAKSPLPARFISREAVFP